MKSPLPVKKNKKNPAPALAPKKNLQRKKAKKKPAPAPQQPPM